MTNLYKDWAIELIDDLMTEWVDPFHPNNYDGAIEKLAKKLKDDVTDSIVPEEFCGDCDYQRRYGQ